MTRRQLLAALAYGATPTTPFSWIDVDLLHKSKAVVWSDVTKPLAFGSLLKPFLALAFAATHNSFPVVVCRGTRDRCWLPRGHGALSVVPALVHSCNCYFLQLVREMDRAALDSVCLRFGLVQPARSVEDDSLVGLGSGWRNSPLAVVQAFSQINDPMVLRALAQCAASGTARNLNLPCYAKTGTAPCSHKPPAPGDGFVAVLYPTDAPRRALLFEQHGTTGAEACRSVKSKIDFH